MDDTLKTMQEWIARFFLESGLRIFGAALIMLVGLLVARWVGRLLARQLDKLRLEPPVRLLLCRLARLLILCFALIIAIQKLGVEIAPLVAGLGIVGVGIGLAMQGVLGNAVAGMTIIFAKPYRVGEYIEITGEEGLVSSIEVFSTTLEHLDGSRVVIPNRKIVGEILHNYGKSRQLDLTVGVSYGSDVRKVIAAINEVLAENSTVLKDPAPLVGVAAFGESSIDISIKPWVRLADYATAGFSIYGEILARFCARGIAIPFPQREVRLLQSPVAAAEVASQFSVPGVDGFGASRH